MNPECKPLTTKPLSFCFVHAGPRLPLPPILWTLSSEPLLFPTEVSSPSILKGSIPRHQSQAIRLFVRDHCLLVSPLQAACLDSHLPSSGDASYLPPPAAPALSAHSACHPSSSECICPQLLPVRLTEPSIRHACPRIQH